MGKVQRGHKEGDSRRCNLPFQILEACMEFRLFALVILDIYCIMSRKIMHQSNILLQTGDAKKQTCYYQLLVRVYQGRYFPPPREDDGRCPMVHFECRFNRESLETDPVPLNSSPVC
jgi:hypothetical protein